ncbi:hypothetical protein BJ085DRAFT_14676 [Dimargaris cristalligena]|uniref:DNA mismatch repair protein S5 domain-containing protein n=1 Tax=Dimargaris cristalligena TaxID=215637 RepID=A0A4Q0A1I9_9FUNG|nr:hypothetical protein BJ085DRAFT_14676 [Dimargaris cristalligena]|eukprot:RKP39943.1 hypothetical protein BJ085DRAFT_14676 [Dimargaris cristalligena]
MADTSPSADAPPPSTPKPIRRLDPTVVNRIAAGEIIHRPANALKELLENALDAGAQSIQILAKDGGLKQLQIQDSGHGIRLADLPLVCERFTTSKLQTFEDLSSIQTFGFRGEALASISHIAHVTITSRTAESNCAYRAKYADGQLVPAKPGTSTDPKPCAGNVGTQILVEDLFYNVPFRRKALKNINDEYNRILEVVSRYAIHNAGVSMSCKKIGTTATDIHTPVGASIVDIISQTHGGKIRSQLLKLECAHANLGFTAKGYVTNANFSTKKMQFLLFINHRLVDSSSLKKAIESVYTTVLPKGSHPFVYLSLSIDPQNVDVNVHPTKREVHFLHEDEITIAIAEALQSTLAGSSESRTYQVQTLLATPMAEDRIDVHLDFHRPTQCAPPSTPAPAPSTPSTSNSRPYEHKLVRTDTRSRTLESFTFTSTPRSKPGPSNRLAQRNRPPDSSVHHSPPTMVPPRIPVRLTSILELRNEVQSNHHRELTRLLNGHTFVGLVDYSRALIQHETRLYMINYIRALEELFYQRTLLQFCNFGAIQIDPPVSLTELFLIALREQHVSRGQDENVNGDSDSNFQSDEDAKYRVLTNLIVSRREMLDEYFYLVVSDRGELQSLPLIIPNYTPNLLKLPLFLLRITTAVNWEEEKQCFRDFSRELARFYSPAPPLVLTDPFPDNHQGDFDPEQAWDTEEMREYRNCIQHTLFPAFKSHFFAPPSLAEAHCLLQLADLPDLYKIFERC